eukprot:TRINITY_DN1641_c0_g1_i2.p1 TRINITY_DN1641_c0_g1~~TRINITY_DN1641_c0_g1_i2.p1  ORF type:complete len:1978 (-),score=555.53 TRINITY_DN1641_c0_g1_i2:59-5992(-)
MAEPVPTKSRSASIGQISPRSDKGSPVATSASPVDGADKAKHRRSGSTEKVPPPSAEPKHTPVLEPYVEVDENDKFQVAYEDYETILLDRKVMNDPLPAVKIPPGIVKVTTEPRVRRTLTPIVPDAPRPVVPAALTHEPDTQPLQDPYLEYCLSLYKRDWTMVKGMSSTTPSDDDSDSPFEAHVTVPTLPVLPDIVYEIDMARDTPVPSSKDPLDVEVLSAVTSKTRAANAEKRHTDRMSVFQVYPMDDPPRVEGFRRGQPPSEVVGRQLLVNFNSLNMHLGEAEPFFLTAFIYDLKSDTTVSEQFHFDLNSDQTKFLLPLELQAVSGEPLSQCRQALFTLHNPGPMMFLVVIIDKVVTGEPDEVSDPYFKHATLKPKDRTKFFADVRESVQRLGHFRQHFAWGAVELFSHKGDMLVPLHVPLKVPNISRAKGELEQFIAKVSDEKEFKKMKATLVPCDLTLTIDDIIDNPISTTSGRITHTLHATSKYPSSRPSSIVKEILEFENPERPIPQIALDYVNVLYFSPNRLNFSNYKSDGKATSARNLCLEVRLMADDNNVNNSGLPLMYGHANPAPLVTHMFSVVDYHNRKPTFLDEVKVQLPVTLTPAHHLLVTFYHVSCKPPKKTKASEKPEMALGYVAIKLLQGPNGTIIPDGKHTAPVALVFPPKYLDMMDHGQEGIMKWVDNKKDVFAFSTRVVSSTYTQDPSLATLLQLKKTPSGDELPAPEVIMYSIGSVANIPNHLKVKHLPVILDILLGIIARANNEVVAKHALVALTAVIAGIPQVDILDSYLSYLFDLTPSWGSSLYTPFLHTWIALLAYKHECVKELLRNAWFFLRVVIKSMALDAGTKGTLKDDTTRKLRYPDLPLVISKLVKYITQEVHQFSKSSLSIAKSLNVCTSLFLRDLLDLMDRGQVFKLIQQYISGLLPTHPRSWSMELVVFKFDSFKIITDHPRFVALNVAVLQSIPAVPDIFATFLRRHFLVNLLLQHVEAAIAAPEHDMRAKAILTLRGLMWRHDHTPSLVAPQMRERVCNLYFPYVLIVLDNFKEKISKWPKNESRDWLGCFMWVLGGMSHTLRSDWWRKDAQKRKLDLLAVLAHALEVFEYSGKDESKGFGSLGISSPHISEGREILSPNGEDDLKKTRNYNTTFFKSRQGTGKGLPTGSMNRDDTKNLLESYYSNKSDSMRSSSPSQMVTSPSSSSSGSSSVSSISLSNSSPASSPSSSSSSSSAASTSSSNLTALSGSGGINRDDRAGSLARQSRMGGSFSGDSPTSSRHKSASSFSTMYHTMSHGQANTISPEIIARAHANLSLEVSAHIFSIVMQFVHDHTTEVTKSGSVYVEPIFTVLVALLEKPQGIQFTHIMLRTLPEVIIDFRAALFKFPTAVCGDLCYVVLRLCLAKSPVTRAMASSLLYILVDQDYRETGNFTRVKLQTTIAISKIVGETTQQDRDYAELMACLEAVTKHVKTNHSSSATSGASSTSGRPPSLATQMEEMKERLFSVIKDSIKIKQFAYDPEMIAELTYQISNGFSESPDLRVTWLTNLVKIHKEANNWEEAAQTCIITAALVGEYLKLLKKFPNRRDIKESSYKRSFPNFDRESTIPEHFKATMSSIASEICQSKVFCEKGYIYLMRDAIQCLKKADLYEHSVQAYKLLLPVYERARDWHHQAEAHSDLTVLCHKVIDDNKASARLFANFYRVAFFGKVFGDLNNSEFIYKEQNHVRLADFSDRLKQQFDSKFGADTTVILPNTKAVDHAALDASKGYLQVISVDPFLTESELVERPTPIEQNFNIAAFTFEVPFTKTGKAHGDMAEQYKRKTILRVEAAFPYLLKRMKVIDKKEIEIVPIQNSLDIIERKTNNLRAELSSGLPNTKTLQINLQGCLLLQVNAGPLEICRVFLDPAVKSKYPAEQIARLTKAMQDFTAVLGQAVQLNSQLIEDKDNQYELHEQLLKGLADFQKKMAEYVPLDAEAATTPLSS